MLGSISKWCTKGEPILSCDEVHLSLQNLIQVDDMGKNIAEGAGTLQQRSPQPLQASYWDFGWTPMCACAV